MFAGPGVGVSLGGGVVGNATGGLVGAGGGVVGEVAANGTSISDPPTQAEMQELQTTINAIITNLQTVKVFK